MPEERIKNLTIEDAQIPRGLRNFTGAEGRYNAKGRRNFIVFINPDDVPTLDKEGWNVKHLKPRDDQEDPPQPFIKVNVKMDGRRPPRVVLISGDTKKELDESTISILDWVDMKYVDLIVRPFRYDPDSKLAAYLQAIYVTMEEDPIAKKYMDLPDSASNVLLPDEEPLF